MERQHLFVVQVLVAYEGPVHQWVFLDRYAAEAKVEEVVADIEAHGWEAEFFGDEVEVLQVPVGADWTWLAPGREEMVLAVVALPRPL